MVVHDFLVHHPNHRDQVVKQKVIIFVHVLFIQHHVIVIVNNITNVKQLNENNMEKLMKRKMKKKKMMIINVHNIILKKEFII